MQSWLRAGKLLLAAWMAGAALAQQPGPAPGEGQEAPPPPPMRPHHGPMDRAFHVGPPGRWWSDPNVAQKLGLTADQQAKMDAVFQQNRLKLIDLSAGLQKQEAILEPLLSADRPDETTVLQQIDRVAQARADLEKANARMLLQLRAELTPEQWKQLREMRRPPNRVQPNTQSQP